MTDTWFYAKRCFLALIEGLAKHTLTLKDSTVKDVIQFLDAAELYGKNIPTTIAPPIAIEDPREKSKFQYATVAQEARSLKRMFLQLSAGK